MKYEMTVHLYKHTIHFFFDRLNEWKKYHFQLQTMDHDTVNIEIYIILVTWDTDAHTFTSVWHPSAIWVATKDSSWKRITPYNLNIIRLKAKNITRVHH